MTTLSNRIFHACTACLQTSCMFQACPLPRMSQGTHCPTEAGHACIGARIRTCCVYYTQHVRTQAQRAGHVHTQDKYAVAADDGTGRQATASPTKTEPATGLHSGSTPPFVSQVQRKPTTRRACVVMNECKSNTYPLAFPPNKGNTHNQARLSEVIGLTPQHSSSPTLIFSRSGQPLMTSLSISSAAGQPINTVASAASRLPIFTPSSSGLDLLASAVAQASPP